MCRGGESKVCAIQEVAQLRVGKGPDHVSRRRVTRKLLESMHCFHTGHQAQKQKPTLLVNYPPPLPRLILSYEDTLSISRSTPSVTKYQSVLKMAQLYFRYINIWAF